MIEITHDNLFERVDALNQIHKQVRTFKYINNCRRAEVNLGSAGGLLNGYREGDITFTEAVEHLSASGERATCKDTVFEAREQVRKLISKSEDKTVTRVLMIAAEALAAAELVVNMNKKSPA